MDKARQEAVESKEYLYLSPVLRFDYESGEIHRLTSAGAGMIDDFSLRGSSGCRQMGVTLSEGGVTSKGDMLLTTTTHFSQRAEPSPLWSKVSPKRRIAPVAVASGAIEASVRGEGEGNGGSDGGEPGGTPPGRGSKGPEPLASPNV